MGAQISISPDGLTLERASKETNSLDGRGASIAVSTVRAAGFPSHGTRTDTAYFANGVAITQDTFTVEAPNAEGISAVTGSGKCVGGTRVHKKEKCSYSITGTLNLRTTVDLVHFTGTDTR